MKTQKNAAVLTINSYQRELQRLLCFLQNNCIYSTSDIKLPDLRNYVQHSQESRNLSPGSVRMIVAILKSFFRYLHEEGKIDNNAARKLGAPKKNSNPPNAMEKHEIDRVLASIKFAPKRCRRNYVRDKLIISTLYYAGLRRSELLKLNWDDLNLEKSYMIIRNSKGGKTRLVPIHPNLTELLDQYLDLRLPLKCNALFIGEQGKRLTKASFTNLIRMFFKIAGLSKKKYTAHSFRHSFATQLVEAGVDIFKVQKLLGHSSLESTRVYVNFSPKAIENAILKL